MAASPQNGRICCAIHRLTMRLHGYNTPEDRGSPSVISRIVYHGKKHHSLCSPMNHRWRSSPLVPPALPLHSSELARSVIFTIECGAPLTSQGPFRQDYLPFNCSSANTTFIADSQNPIANLSACELKLRAIQQIMSGPFEFGRAAHPP